MAAPSTVCQELAGTDCQAGKHGGAPSPGVPFSVKNKAEDRFLLGLAAGSEGEGGDVG